MATVYKFDEDTVWQEAATKAAEVVEEARQKIAKRCQQLGIPARYAPDLQLTWAGRGENAMASRRAELRRAAEATIEEMRLAAETKIDKQSLDLRTQVVAMGVLSPGAKLFLESLASVDEAMRALDFGDIEKRLELNKQNMRRLGGY